MPTNKHHDAPSAPLTETGVAVSFTAVAYRLARAFARLAVLADDAARWLEDRGHRACPSCRCPTTAPTGYCACCTFQEAP